jgi:hypothetical protein
MEYLKCLKPMGGDFLCVCSRDMTSQDMATKKKVAESRREILVKNWRDNVA